MAKTPISAEDLRRVLEAAVDTGKATGGSANTLVDTTKSWPVNAWVDLVVDITNGTGQGQIRRIASNTANTLTISTNWDTVPDASSEYEIKFFSTISGTITVADIEKWGGTVITGRDISLDFAELPVIRDILGTTALSTIQEIEDDIRTAVQSVDGNVVEIKNILGTTALSTIQEIEDDILTAVTSMDGKIPSDPATVTEQQVVQSILGTTALSTIQEIEDDILTAVTSMDGKIPSDPATVTEQQVVQSILGTTALSTIQEIEDDIKTAVESIDGKIPSDPATVTEQQVVQSILGTTVLSTIQEIENDILTAVGKEVPPSSAPTVYVKTLTTIDTEYNQVLPPPIKYFEVKPRQSNPYRMAWETGKVATPTDPHVSMPANLAYSSPEVYVLSTMTIYLASGIPAQDMEIIKY